MKSLNKELFRDAAAKMAACNPVLLVTHINPDGDAIGSLLAMQLYLRKKGFETYAVTPNKYPEFLQWLEGNNNVMIFSQQRKRVLETLARCKAIVALDFNVLKRTGELEQPIHDADALKVLIDHHPNPNNFQHFTLSDTSVCSTSELVYEYIVQNGDRHLIDTAIAECIFTGIMTDTGCFSFNSSEPRTWEIVGDLLNFGINKDRIYSLVYDNFAENRMRLMGYCLNEKMVVLPEYKAAYITLSLEEQRRFNFAIGDSEGFVNLPLSIRGIKFSTLFLEKADHVKLSFRSKGEFAVNRFSELHFGGGGHTNASGGETKLNLADTVQKYLDTLPLFADELKNA